MGIWKKIGKGAKWTGKAVLRDRGLLSPASSNFEDVLKKLLKDSREEIVDMIAEGFYRAMIQMELDAGEEDSNRELPSS